MRNNGFDAYETPTAQQMQAYVRRAHDHRGAAVRNLPSGFVRTVRGWFTSSKPAPVIGQVCHN